MKNTDINRVIALTEGGMLCAIAFVLLSMQFTLLFSAPIFLLLTPAVFGIAAARLPLRILGMVVLVIVGGAAAFFGIGMGLWALAYALYGGMAGLLHRCHVWSPVRLFLLIPWFLLVLAFMIGLLMAGAGVTDAMLIDNVMLFAAILAQPVEGTAETGLSLMLVALIGWSFLNTFFVNKGLDSLLNKLVTDIN